MSSIRVITRKDAENLLDMPSVIAAVETAYKQKCVGEGVIWPLVFYEFEPGKADMDIKSGFIKGEGIYGLKLVSWHGGNPENGLPALHGTTMVFDAPTGRPVGLLDAEYITGMRTGAAGAIGAKYLARKDSENLLLVGAGHQALFLLTATLLVLPGIKTVRVCDPMSEANAEAFCGKARAALPDYFDSGLTIEAVTALESAVSKSDVIITATPSRKPLIRKEWLKPGTHLSCIGADMSGKQEIDEQILAGARVFTDDINQAFAVGECETAGKKGLLTPQTIAGEIGRLILDLAPGRQSEAEITVFDSTGIALQDLIVSHLALKLAGEKGAGTSVEL